MVELPDTMYLYCRYRLRSVWHVLRCTCNHSKCSCMSDSAVHVIIFVLYISGIRSPMNTTTVEPMYVWSSHIARVWINQVRLPILHVVNWKGKMNIALSASAPENLVVRDGFGSPVSRQPAHLHTQAESGAYIRNSSRFPQRRPNLLSIHLKWKNV